MLRLIEEDVELGGGLISIDGQVYDVELDTLSIERTPICPIGTYVKGQTDLDCGQ